MTVHRADCPNIRNLDDEGHDRLIEVSWTTDTDVSYPVEILIIAIERVGLLRDISEVFSKEKQPVSCYELFKKQRRLAFQLYY